MKGGVRGGVRLSRGRAASHQQRQAEEAPSRQQLRSGRRHLRLRQQRQAHPLCEAGTFKGAGIVSPWRPCLAAAGSAAQRDVMCLCLCL